MGKIASFESFCCRVTHTLVTRCISFLPEASKFPTVDPSHLAASPMVSGHFCTSQTASVLSIQLVMPHLLTSMRLCSVQKLSYYSSTLYLLF